MKLQHGLRLSVSLCFLFFSLLMVSCKYRPGIGYNQGYQPDQPIHFSHELHAGQYKMQCQYCHAQAESSLSEQVSVPSLNICMNCHLSVATDKYEVKKLIDAYLQKKPVQWTKVNRLPDHVQFNHKPHLRKNLACQECHGPVETMEVYRQHEDPSMGWCLTCHRDNNHQAPTNCSTCHY